jgi:hypothetical protein
MPLAETPCAYGGKAFYFEKESDKGKEKTLRAFLLTEANLYLCVHSVQKWTLSNLFFPEF